MMRQVSRHGVEAAKLHVFLFYDPLVKYAESPPTPRLATVSQSVCPNGNATFVRLRPGAEDVPRRDLSTSGHRFLRQAASHTGGDCPGQI